MHIKKINEQKTHWLQNWKKKFQALEKKDMNKECEEGKKKKVCSYRTLGEKIETAKNHLAKKCSQKYREIRRACKWNNHRSKHWSWKHRILHTIDWGMVSRGNFALARRGKRLRSRWSSLLVKHVPGRQSFADDRHGPVDALIVHMEPLHWKDVWKMPPQYRQPFQTRLLRWSNDFYVWSNDFYVWSNDFYVWSTSTKLKKQIKKFW